MITQEELKRILDYDPETGIFRWNSYGKPVAGTISKGYISIQWKRTKYKAHRLAFLYMEGKFPSEDVDHVNGIRNDNRWINLRRCTRSQNRCNVSLMNRNTSGIKGVHKGRNGWFAQCQVNYRRVSFGPFSSKEHADEYLKKIRKNMHGEFVNHGEYQGV